MKIVGIELIPKDGASLCFMTESVDKVMSVESHNEIIKLVEDFKPDIVAIGSPLSLPEKGGWRKAEEELHKRNIKFNPPKGLLDVEKIVMIGRELKSRFQSKGFLVIETNPNGFLDLINIPRNNNYLQIKRILKVYGLNMLREQYNQNELRAVLSAFTGRLFLEAKVEFLGDENEGQIVMPKIIRR